MKPSYRRRVIDKSIDSADRIQTVEVPEELALFRNVAAGLSADVSARDIADIICQYRDNAQSGVFLVVEAPSGSGKSQLPFTIAELEIPTVHVVLSSFDIISKTQTIYQALLRPSLCIQSALNHDRFKWSDSASCGVTALRMCEEQLAVVRVIFYLLEDPADVVNDTTSYTIETLVRYVKSKTAASLPVFFLDEAMAIEGGDHALRYLRNVFRAAGLLVVLMGTNSTAAILVGRTPMASRGTDKLCQWCYVITRLPTCTTDSLAALGWTTTVQQDFSNRGPSWHALVNAVNSSQSTSNPWFLRTVIEAMRSTAAVLDGRLVSTDSPAPSFADIFDQLLCSAAERIWAAKGGLSTAEGLRAQICLFLNMYQSTDDDVFANQVKRFVQKSSRVFVSHHFAIPTESNFLLNLGVFLPTTGSCLLQTEDGKPWDEDGADSARFAICGDDPWLYLLFGGGRSKGMGPYRHGGRCLTTHAAFSKVKQRSDKHGLNTANVAAQFREGNSLEAMGVCAMIAASRCGGVAGSTWSNFVLHLATHLVCNGNLSVDGLLWNWDASADLESMGSLVQEWVIPFLGPPNSDWPKYFAETPGICLGNVKRAPNSDMVDCTVSGFNGSLSFKGEFKNYEDRINAKVFQGILFRVPEKAKFHLVVLSQLQRSYKIDWNDSRFGHLTNANLMKVVVTNRSNRSLSLEPLFADRMISWYDCQALILFVEEAVINGDQVPLAVSSSSSNMPAQKKRKLF